MSLLWQSAKEGVERWADLYQTYIYDLADPRTKEWPMSDSLWQPVLVMACYVAFCAKAKDIMAERKALELRPLMIAYNLCQVLLSGYMAKEFVATSFLASYNLLACQPVDYSSAPLAMRMASVCWWYYFSKYVDLLDTVFIVLRKKFEQISFLHVYHHTTMILNWWMAVKFIAGGGTFFNGMVTSFVHVIMYSYYGLSCCGPSVRRHLWWKRYLTRVQIAQFFLIMFHSGHNYSADCNFPGWINAWSILYLFSLVALFANFYLRAYTAFGAKKNK